jgi:hypothetical protein
LVCSNGFGHLKRCLQVAEHIPPEFTINFFCKEFLINFARKEANFKYGSSINFISKYSFNEFSWIDENQITWEKYNAWKKILESSSELINSHLVVSDNHVLPGSLFNNVIFMGSFLWHDSTTSKDKQVNEIISHEKFILSTKPFSLLCVSDMVMPSLSNQVCKLDQGWFTARKEFIKKQGPLKKILITGGGTELMNNQLAELLFCLNNLNPKSIFYLDHKLYLHALKLSHGFRLFNFTEEEFESLDIIICRPGIGILTDCIRYSVPCIAMNDSFNREINHNMTRVNELGIGMGFDFNDLPIIDLATLINNFINNSEFISGCINNLRKRPINGALTAAEHLVKIMENEKN